MDLAIFLHRLWSAGLEAGAARSPPCDRHVHRPGGRWRDSSSPVHVNPGLAADDVHSTGLLADGTVRCSIESIVPGEARILRPEVSQAGPASFHVAARAGLLILLSTGT